MFTLEETGGAFPPEVLTQLAQAHFTNELSGFIVTVAAIYATSLRMKMQLIC
ncbi:unnamed protein product [Hymenolepis diminuta]|uniref:Uncharacterized protein n=1 Tax=Hymenolepis diminuta TaxID=6216 RepID=A0A564YFD5_HYMDI|nr:unnamed protein product [Hymenolepis diminuta]